MKLRYWMLIGLFAFTLGLRLFLAFQTEAFSYDAYQEIRYIDYLKEHRAPMRFDDLSYGGREIVTRPVFSYLLWAGSLIHPYALKIIPNLIISLFVLVAYLCAWKLTKDPVASLTSAFLAGFIPVLYDTTLFSLSSIALALPLMFLCAYFFMDIEKRVVGYLLCFLSLTLVSPVVFVFVLGIILHLAIARLEGLRTSRAELEVGLFSLFFSIWLQFVLHKKALLFHGIGVIWQNIPNNFRVDLFGANLIDSFTLIGILPFILGTYVVYRYVFQDKDRRVNLFSSLAISLGTLLWLGLISLPVGLSILGAVLVVLVGKFMQHFLGYIKKTNVSHHQTAILVAIFCVIALTAIIPSISIALRDLSVDVPSKDELMAIDYLRKAPDGVVAADVEDGFIVSALSGKGVIANRNFLMVNDPGQSLTDIEGIFEKGYKTDSLAILGKYDARYIYLSRNAEARFNVSALRYADSCFPLVYSDNVKVYRVACTLEG